MPQLSVLDLDGVRLATEQARHGIADRHLAGVLGIECSPRSTSLHRRSSGSMLRGIRSKGDGSGRVSRRHVPSVPRSMASLGAPSAPHRSDACVTLARRKMACSVRTCLSSPVCEAHMMASSDGVSARSSAAPNSMSATSAEWFHGRAEHDLDGRGADGADDRAPGVDLHDVATMAALDGAAALHLHQHRRRGTLTRSRRTPGRASCCSVGAARQCRGGVLGFRDRKCGDGLLLGTCRWYRGEARPVFEIDRVRGSSPSRGRAEARPRVGRGPLKSGLAIPL